MNSIIPRILSDYRRLGVGPDRLPKFARSNAMELHNRRVQDMRASSVELAKRAKQAFVTTWRIVADDKPTPHPYERDNEDSGNCAECGRGISDQIHEEQTAAQGNEAGSFSNIPEAEYAAQLRPGRYIVCLGAKCEYEVWDWKGDHWEDDRKKSRRLMRGNGWCDGFLARIDEVVSQSAEIASLREKLAEAERGNVVRDEMLKSMSDYGQIANERDRLAAQVAELQGTLAEAQAYRQEGHDRALARVAEMERERDEWKDRCITAVHNATIVADHAENCHIVSTPAYQLAVARIGTVRGCDTPIPGLIAERDKALAELAAERERREKAERTMLRALEPDPALAAARAEAEAAKQEAEGLNALYIQSREASATHRCKVCGAKWILFDGETPPTSGWSLASKTCGKCCDTVAMADQIEAIGLTARVRDLERVRDEVCDHRDQLRRQVEQLQAKLTLSGAESGMLPSEVSDELARATAKFPTWPTDALHALAVLGEEFGELTKAVLQGVYEPHKNHPCAVRSEAVQTAAMALRFLASVSRYTTHPCPQHTQNAAEVAS